MKYVVIIGDGMADRPIPELDNKTPLQVASKPNMDFLARNGITGMVKTIPEGMSIGSDVANLSVLGYDPVLYHSGRSPLEAIAMGIQMDADDMAFRCNLVNLSEDANYSDRKMVDYSSDEITSEEAGELIKAINMRFKNQFISFYAGVSYRHCMIWKNGPQDLELTPPHDITGKKIAGFLPRGNQSGILLDMMSESVKILENHPVNIKRRQRGLKPANSIWLWGQGRKPAISSFREKYGITGSVVSAVDLIKGIGLCAGLDIVEVEGATGNINTNFKGKAMAALRELDKGNDFVYVHIEAPDECGHRYEINNKVRSIELIDDQVLKTLLEGLEKYDDYKIMLLPDHATPLSIRTHSSEPVPFTIYQKSRSKATNIERFDEFEPQKSGLFIDKGHTLMDMFIKGN